MISVNWHGNQGRHTKQHSSANRNSHCRCAHVCIISTFLSCSSHSRVTAWCKMHVQMQISMYGFWVLHSVCWCFACTTRCNSCGEHYLQSKNRLPEAVGATESRVGTGALVGYASHFRCCPGVRQKQCEALLSDCTDYIAKRNLLQQSIQSGVRRRTLRARTSHALSAKMVAVSNDAQNCRVVAMFWCSDYRTTHILRVSEIRARLLAGL